MLQMREAAAAAAAAAAKARKVDLRQVEVKVQRGEVRKWAEEALLAGGRRRSVAL